jgi:hypothetical protein
VLFILSEGLPWMKTLDLQAMKIVSQTGWRYLFSQPQTWIIVLLVVMGTLGLWYFREKRFAFFTEIAGIISLIFLIQPFLKYSMNKWAEVFEFGYFLGLVLLVLLLILVFLYHSCLSKEKKA